jgi:hypothetical protein
VRESTHNLSLSLSLSLSALGTTKSTKKVKLIIENNLKSSIQIPSRCGDPVILITKSHFGTKNLQFLKRNSIKLGKLQAWPETGSGENW